MRITSIDIVSFTVSGMQTEQEGLQHRKSLPQLSVVQAQKGSYEIALGASRPVSTGEGGIFLAPSGVMQTICHHVGADGLMQARWAFLDVRIDHEYRLDDLIRLPVLVPQQETAAVSTCLEKLGGDISLCARYAVVYELVEILLRIGTPQPLPEQPQLRLRAYVQEHCGEEITAQELAKELHCSVSQVFRYSKSWFGTSPANYINSVRVQKAAELLECSDHRIGEIGIRLGFNDAAYFSRVFRTCMGCSPREYRAFYQKTRQNTAEKERENFVWRNGKKEM